MTRPQLLDLKALQKEYLRSTWEGATGSFEVKSPGSNAAQPNALIVEPPEVDGRNGQLNAIPPILLENKTVLNVPAPQQKGQASYIFTQRTELLDKFPTNKLINYKIRMLQFARAAQFILKHQTPTLDQKSIEASMLRIQTMLTALELVPTNKLNSRANAIFVSIAKEIAEQLTISTKQAEKQLCLAELIVLWKEGRPEQKNTSYLTEVGRRLKIERVDTPLRGFTEKQKKEYEKILGENKPLWFQSQHPLLKNYLLKKVRKAQANNDWSVLENAIPATLRGVPGLANATLGHTIITDISDPAKPILLSDSFRYASSTPVPIDLAGRKFARERAKITKLNLLQYIKHKIDKAKKSEEENLSAEKNLIFPINSLLNELWGEDLFPHKENNTRFLNEIRAAIKKINSKRPELRIILTNTPTNNLRYVALIRRKEKKDDQQYMDYCINNIPAEALNTLNSLEKSDPTYKRTLQNLPSRQRELFAALKALEELQKSSDYFGDQNLIRAGLYEIILPENLSTCKSTKDREKFKLDYVESLRSFYYLYEEFPNFNLPAKLGIILSMSARLGVAAAAAALVLGLMAGALVPLAATIGLAVGGAALSLGIGAYALFQKKVNYQARINFLKIFRHIRYTGFSALTASMNAPGAYGQKNPDILPDDVSQLRQAQFPFRPTQFLVDLPVYIALDTAVGVGLYFLLIHTVGFAPPLLAALPVLLAACIVAPQLASLGAKLIRYYSAPQVTDEIEVRARRAFANALELDQELAEGNKYKANSSQAELNAIRNHINLTTLHGVHLSPSPSPDKATKIIRVAAKQELPTASSESLTPNQSLRKETSE